MKIAWEKPEKPSAATWVLRLPIVGLTALVQPTGAWTVFRSTGVFSEEASGKATSQDKAKSAAVCAMINAVTAKQDELRRVGDALVEIM